MKIEELEHTGEFSMLFPDAYIKFIGNEVHASYKGKLYKFEKSEFDRIVWQIADKLIRNTWQLSGLTGNELESKVQQSKIRLILNEAIHG